MVGYVGLAVYRAFIAFICCLTHGLWANEPQPWQMHFQSAATPVMKRIVSLHDTVTFVMFGIVVLVVFLILVTVWRFHHRRNPHPSTTRHNVLLEVVWTAIPVVIVLAITVPSVRLQFYMDKVHNPELTIKVTGYQWYWGYEYPEYGIGFESRMLEGEDLKPADKRLLSVDQPLVIPVNTNVRILTTAADVIHSWAVPAFGIKKDTIPGRLNETWVRVSREGTYYGQCSELCGSGHGFMPIEVQVVSKSKFQDWVRKHEKPDKKVKVENDSNS